MFIFLLVVFQNPLQNYCFFFIPTRRHKKVAYLPKSRNCVNTGQTPLQKNANIFIFLIFPLRNLVNLRKNITFGQKGPQKLVYLRKK
jgi:hypothetical protein